MRLLGFPNQFFSCFTWLLEFHSNSKAEVSLCPHTGWDVRNYLVENASLSKSANRKGKT